MQRLTLRLLALFQHGLCRRFQHGSTRHQYGWTSWNQHEPCSRWRCVLVCAGTYTVSRDSHTVPIRFSHRYLHGAHAVCTISNTVYTSLLFAFTLYPLVQVHICRSRFIITSSCQSRHGFHAFEHGLSRFIHGLHHFSNRAEPCRSSFLQERTVFSENKPFQYNKSHTENMVQLPLKNGAKRVWTATDQAWTHAIRVGSDVNRYKPALTDTKRCRQKKSFFRCEIFWQIVLNRAESYWEARMVSTVL